MHASRLQSCIIGIDVRSRLDNLENTGYLGIVIS